MAQWNDDKELFDLMKEKLYTPVVMCLTVLKNPLAI